MSEERIARFRVNPFNFRRSISSPSQHDNHSRSMKVRICLWLMRLLRINQEELFPPDVQEDLTSEYPDKENIPDLSCLLMAQEDGLPATKIVVQNPETGIYFVPVQCTDSNYTQRL